MIHTGNMRLTDPPCNNGDEFSDFNLTQAVADTPICVGKTGLTYTNGNLINCIVPVDADVDGCNTCKKDFCVHNHPDFGLPSEPVECRHWIGADIDADGELVNEYEDITL